MAPMEVHRFRRELRPPIEEPRWPAGFSIIPFEPTSHACIAHRLLQEGYAHGGGTVAQFDAWRSGLVNDAEYDPELIFLVGAQAATPVAVAICWTSAFVKDLAVAGHARRLGLATNLLRHVFRVFRERGANTVDLKVTSDNLAAISLYRSLGMKCVETLG